MEIRPPQKPNYPAIAEMLSLALGRSWDAEALAGMVMADERFDPNLVLVAREKGETLGFLHAVLEGENAWIKLVAVHPSRRRQGLGREMLERMEERVFGEGARFSRAGFCPPPQFGPGVPASAAAFFEALGYTRHPGGCEGRLEGQGIEGPAGAQVASLLIRGTAPLWQAYSEEQASFQPPRLSASRDGRAACFWEPGRVGPLFEREAPLHSQVEAVRAAQFLAGPQGVEFSDSRPGAWWRERFEIQRATDCFEMQKDLKGVFHA